MLSTNRVIEWVAMHVVPAEPRVRAWLQAQGVGEEHADDLVQEAYCRIAALASVDHISRADSYLFTVVRNLRLEEIRRNRVVPIVALTEELISCIKDDAPDPEHAALAKAELAQVQHIMAELPDRCRTIFHLKRVEGLSQREIAARLQISENIVENDVMKGLRHILAGLSRAKDKSDGSLNDDSLGRPRRA